MGGEGPLGSTGRGKGDRFQIQGEGGEQLDMRHLAVFDGKGKGHEVPLSHFRSITVFVGMLPYLALFVGNPGEI